MNEFDNNVMFDPMDIDLSDVDMDYYEDPETGAVSYDKPIEEDYGEQELSQVANDDENDWSPENEPLDASQTLSEAPEDAIIYKTSDGTAITKKRAIELSERSREIEDNHAYITEIANNIKQSEKHLDFIKKRGVAEVDFKIAAIDEQMATTTDPHTIGQLTLQRQKLVGKQKILNDEYANADALVQAEKNELLGIKIKNTDEAMLQKYGAEWKRDGSAIYTWAQQVMGIPSDGIREALSPGLADVLVMASKYAKIVEAQKHKRDAEVKATLARSKRPSQTRSRIEEPVRVNVQAQDRVVSGKASFTDLAAAFDPDWA